MVHNDCVDEVRRMASNSVDLIVTSIPFSTQYEYSPNYADFGHTDDNDHFWRQMGFLIPELLRVLKPGRDACIHVKDRIVPGGLTGSASRPCSRSATSAATTSGGRLRLPGHDHQHTDVVRENNQTYRLGHEQLKDGTRMGCGVPEQIILLRKPPSTSPTATPTSRWSRRGRTMSTPTAAAPYDRQAPSRRARSGRCRAPAIQPRPLAAGRLGLVAIGRRPAAEAGGVADLRQHGRGLPAVEAASASTRSTTTSSTC
jgi:hypothetical protein